MTCFHNIAELKYISNAVSFEAINWASKTIDDSMADGPTKNVVMFASALVLGPVTAVLAIVESVVRSIFAGLAWVASLLTGGEIKDSLQHLAQRLWGSVVDLTQAKVLLCNTIPEADEEVANARFGSISALVLAIAFPFLVAKRIFEEDCSCKGSITDEPAAEPAGPSRLRTRDDGHRPYGHVISHGDRDRPRVRPETQFRGRRVERRPGGMVVQRGAY